MEERGRGEGLWSEEDYRQRCGSISFRCGSGSWDPHYGIVAPDPDPRIHLSGIVDPDTRINLCKEWILIWGSK